MSWNPLSWLKPATELVDSIGDAIDKNITSDEERLKLRNELVKLKTSFSLRMAEISAQVSAEVTKRWESDNQGSVLARNVRPFTLLYLLFVVTLLSITDGNFGGFVVKGVYISLYETLLVTVFIAYFGSRGIEKSVNWYTARMSEKEKK